MWENSVEFGLKNVQKRLGCEGCVYANKAAREKRSPCCSIVFFGGGYLEPALGLNGECLERKPVQVFRFNKCLKSSFLTGRF